VAKILNAHPAEIFFTSGGTESSNTAISAAVRDLGCTHINQFLRWSIMLRCIPSSICISGARLRSAMSMYCLTAIIDLEDLEHKLANSSEKTLVTLMQRE